MYIYLYVYVHTCIHVYVYTHVCVAFTYVSLHVFWPVSLSVSFYTFIYTCT